LPAPGKRPGSAELFRMAGSPERLLAGVRPTCSGWCDPGPGLHSRRGPDVWGCRSAISPGPQWRSGGDVHLLGAIPDRIVWSGRPAHARQRAL